MSKVSTNVAVYAFVGWMSSIIMYIIYLLWSFLPESILHGIGITYYPSRYYAIALPAYLIVIYALSGVSYIGINMMNTHNPNDLHTVTDKYSKSSDVYNHTFVKCGIREGMPDVSDIHPKFISNYMK